MKKYMAIIGVSGGFDKEMRKRMNSPVWHMDTKRPKVPYLQLKIKVVETERRFENNDSIWTKTINLFGFQIVLTRRSKKRK